MTPDDVLEDVADILGLVERADDRVNDERADLVSALDELDRLVDHRARLLDLLLLALERELVAAHVDGDVQAVAERVERAVADPGQLGRDLVETSSTCCTGPV